MTTMEGYVEKFKHISNELELKIRRGFSDNLKNFIVLKKWLIDAVGQMVIHEEDLYSYKVRVKTVDSLLNKLSDKIQIEKDLIKSKTIEEKDLKWSKVSNFNDLNELVDDFVGCRIMTFVNGALPTLHQYLSAESEVFNIKKVTVHDFAERPSFAGLKFSNGVVEERKNYNGYVGIHYVVEPKTVDPCWSKEPFIFDKFELQTRSLLQESWGEVQHEVIYKGKRMPDHVKQAKNTTFADLADLLLSCDRILSRMSSESKELKS